jgi:hypothetical protein
MIMIIIIITIMIIIMWAAMGWTVQGSNPGQGEIFLIRPYRPWGPPSLLFNGTGSSLRIKKKEWSYTSTPLLGLHASPREFTVLVLLSRTS